MFLTKMRCKLLGEDVKRNSQEMKRQAVVMPAMTAKQPFHYVIATLAGSRSIISMGTCSMEVYGDVHRKKGRRCEWNGVGGEPPSLNHDPEYNLV